VAYTPPAYNAVNFDLGSGYSQPAYNAVDFDLSDGSTQSSSFTGSGGGLAGGLAAIAVGLVLIASGGAIAGGSAEVTSQQGNAQTFIASGGSVAGGSAIVQAVNVQVATLLGSGGSVAGGSSMVVQGRVADASGGSVAGGSAGESRFIAQVGTHVADGGAVVGGSAEMGAGAIFFASGGGVVGGGALTSRYPELLDVAILGRGGAVGGGSAIIVYGPSEFASGGAVCGGSADVNFVNIYQGAPIVAPPTISATYVKSTASSTATGLTSPLPAVDINNTPSAYYNAAAYNSWRTATNSYNGAKINVDYQTAFAANKVLVCNYFDYDSGGDQTKDTTYGFSSIRVYGSNTQSDFDDTTLNSVPANGTLLLNTTTLNEQASGAQYTNTQEISFSNTTNYRYYIFFFSGTKGATQGGVRVLGLKSSNIGVTGSLSVNVPLPAPLLSTRTAILNPPAFSATYAKSSPSYGGVLGDAFRAIDPSVAVSGSSSYAAWLCNTNQIVGSKINIDYGVAVKAHELRLWNYHNSGSEFDKGIGSVRVYGSNDVADFNNVTLNSVPASGVLLLGTTTVARETTNNGTEQIFWFGNTTAYRYYIVFFPSGAGHLNYAGVRKVLLRGTPNPITATISASTPAIRASSYAQNGGNLPILPIANTAEYVKPSGVGYENVAAYNATMQDDQTSLIGAAAYNSYRNSVTGSTMGFQIQTRSIPTIIDIENYHDSGAETDRGVNSFGLYGSNDIDSFDDFGAEWGTGTLLYSGNASAHAATNTPERQRFTFTNTNSYRFFYLKLNSNHGDNQYCGIRRVTLFGTVDPVNYAFIDASIPSMDAECRALAPELITLITAKLKRLVAVFNQGAVPVITSTIKTLTAFFAVNNQEGPPVGNIDATLPSIYAENPEPAWGHIGATLPNLTSTALANRRMSVPLPGISSAMTTKPPSINAHLSAILAGPEANAYTGNAVIAILGSCEADIDAKVAFRSYIASIMAPPVVLFSATADEDPGNIDVLVEATIPRIAATLEALVGRSADINASMGAPRVTIRAIAGSVADVSSRLPKLSASMKARPSSCVIGATIGSLSANITTIHICTPEILNYTQGAIQ
jgi:hypothetical protein